MNSMAFYCAIYINKWGNEDQRVFKLQLPSFSYMVSRNMKRNRRIYVFFPMGNFLNLNIHDCIIKNLSDFFPLKMTVLTLHFYDEAINYKQNGLFLLKILNFQIVQIQMVVLVWAHGEERTPSGEYIWSDSETSWTSNKEKRKRQRSHNLFQGMILVS